MKKRILKASLKILFALVVSNLLVICLILNPSILYAKHTKIKNINVYHNKDLPVGFENTMLKSISMVNTSEIYDLNFDIDICLNDDSYYTKIIEAIKGKGFAHGFYNKVVITSNTDFESNISELNSRKWNLYQLIAHEMIHCYQYNVYGLKTLSIPAWKLEGYAEYIARGTTLNKDITEEEIQDSWVNFSDGTGCPITYFNDYKKVKDLMASSTYKAILNTTEK